MAKVMTENKEREKSIFNKKEEVVYNDQNDYFINNNNLIDVLEQLKCNVSQLEDIHSRVRFMISEVSQIVNVKKS